MRSNVVEFESASLRLRSVSCRAAAQGCGDIEYSLTSTLVLPQSGVFVKHESPHSALAADAAHGVFFTAGRPYRVSHPTPDGDECLVVEYSTEAMLEILRTPDPPAADIPGTPFRAHGVRLEPGTILMARLLRHRLTRRIADPLEVEETAFALFVAALASGRGGLRADRPTRRDAARRAEIARAIQLTIAHQPAERWSLATLARGAQCSPFHLARAFREIVGIPIHQYQLRARLTLALDGILDSRRGLSAVALEAGFAHHSHLTEAFHRTFGMTPSALRRQARATDVSRLRNFLTADGRPTS